MAMVAPSLVWRGQEERPRRSFPEQRVALFGLAIVLALGCAVRFINLDAVPLHNNELNHYYVARALQNGGPPLLPSGEWYSRGLEYSRIVSLALPWLTPAELAVRLPAALFGAASILIFAIIAWRMARPYAALYATLLFAVYPPLVELSRFGRFYTLQIALGLVALFAGWQAIRNGPDCVRPRYDLLREWAWILLAGTALAFAARIQIVTLSVVLGLAAAVAVRAFAGCRAWRWDALRRSMPLQVCLLGCAGAISLMLVRPESVGLLAGRIRNVPFWARAGGENVSSYFAFLAGSLPILAIAGAAALYWVVRRHGMLGIYLALWFGVPFIVHSMLPWKAGRFIMLALPALMLAVAISSADGLAALVGVMKRRLGQLRVPGLVAEVSTSTVAVVLAIAALSPIPAVRIAAWLRPDPNPGWRESLQIARAVPGIAAIPMGHSLPLPALHYWGGLDFTINESLREQWLTRDRKRALLGVDEADGYAWLPMGSPDLYTGRPVLSTAGAIRSHYANAGEVLIGLHTDGPILGIDADFKRMLTQEATELCRGQCGPMVLYHWQFGTGAGVDPAKGGS